MSSRDSAWEMRVLLNGLPDPSWKTNYARKYSDVSKLEDELLEAGCPQVEIEDLLTELAYYRDLTTANESIRLMAILRASLDQPGESSTIVETKATEAEGKPKFPTALDKLNVMTRGGGYGLTTVGGDAKTGKTTFAVGAACAAAADGWRVVYFNAELDEVEIVQALMRYGGGEIPVGCSDRLRIINPDFTFQPCHAVERVQQAVQLSDSRVLIVLDSINALVDLSGDGLDGEYWALNSVWRNWAIRATKQSRGALAFLVTSETNQHGGIKGRQLEFKSDLVVRIMKAEDKSQVDRVAITVTHSRSTTSGPLGEFFRNWRTGRFE